MEVQVADAPSWAEFRALARRVSLLAECHEAAAEYLNSFGVPYEVCVSVCACMYAAGRRLVACACARIHAGV